MKMPGARQTIPKPVPQEVDALDARVSSSLRDFNVHARNCIDCVDPYVVHMSPTRQLCDSGHDLAQKVAVNLYSKARTSPQGRIEVKFPVGWESVDGLIRAITHSLQGEPTNWIIHDAHQSSSFARSATTAGKVRYVPASKHEQPLNRGSAFDRDVSRRTGEPPRRQSYIEPSSSHRHSYSDPRNSSFDLNGAHRSPSPSSSSSSRRRARATEEAPRQQLVRTNSMRQPGPRVAFNPEVETRYF